MPGKLDKQLFLAADVQAEGDMQDATTAIRFGLAC